MRVVEEPFVTRDQILAIFRPGRPATESPFRTLRKHQLASSGRRVDVRTGTGRLLGRAHLYSSLNTDAARAARGDDHTLAAQFAARARQLECSKDARVVVQAVCDLAAAMPQDPLDADAPPSLQRYVRLRHSSQLLDHRALVRDWLVHSDAWLTTDVREEIKPSIVALARAASEARAELLGDAFQAVSVVYGLVNRMDDSAVEIESSEETVLVPRDDLERQGLAHIGQAVALLCEVLPAGGSLVLPMSAVDLDQEAPSRAPSPWALEDDEDDDGERPMVAAMLSARDEAWIERGRRRPSSVPVVAPLRRR